MKRNAAIALALFLGAFVFSACAVGDQAATSSGTSVTTPSSTGVFEAPLDESKFSLASPPSASSQTVASAPASKHESDSVLGIAPSQLPAAFTPPSAGQPRERRGARRGQPTGLPESKSAPPRAGPDLCRNRRLHEPQANYEAVGTGLPANAFLPPTALYPYFYPYITRVYYPIYTPAPIFVGRPISPSYAPLPPAFHPPSYRPSPFHNGGGGFGGHHR